MCIRCNRQYNEPADEQGDHDCPGCGLTPEQRHVPPCESCGELPVRCLCDEPMAAFLALKPGVVDAIDAMLAMCAAVNKNRLTIMDLKNGVRLAIEDGHDTASIALFMMSKAVELATPGDEPETKGGE